MGGLAYAGITYGLPDRKVSLFVVLSLQNGGRLARSKRKLFPFDDAELAELEAIVGAAMRGEAGTS